MNFVQVPVTVTHNYDYRPQPLLKAGLSFAMASVALTGLGLSSLSVGLNDFDQTFSRISLQQQTEKDRAMERSKDLADDRLRQMQLDAARNKTQTIEQNQTSSAERLQAELTNQTQFLRQNQTSLSEQLLALAEKLEEFAAKYILSQHLEQSGLLLHH